MTDKNKWLNATIEAAIDPAEVIVDTHHHLWDFPTGTYLVPELHEDTGAGHNVVQTVFVECWSAYFEDGPDEMKPVG